MSEQGFGSSGPDHSGSPHFSESEPNGSSGWRAPWRRQAPDRTQEDPPNGVLPQMPAADGAHAGAGPEQVAPGVIVTGTPGTHLHSKVDVVAGTIHTFYNQTRKLDLLEGRRLDRGEVLNQPFVCEEAWAQAWQQAL